MGLNLILFGLLEYFFRRRKYDGQITAYYLVGYGVIRFTTEFFRGDVPHIFLSLTQAQCIAGVIFAAGVGLWIYRRRTQKAASTPPRMENKSEQFTIDVSLPLERMDVFLKTRYPDQSRATRQRLIAEGHMRVNGEVIRPTRHPRAGDLVTLHWPEPKPAEAQPEDMGLDILFEDESPWSLINSPESVCIRPPAMTTHTIVNACSITVGGN